MHINKIMANVRDAKLSKMHTALWKVSQISYNTHNTLDVLQGRFRTLTLRNATDAELKKAEMEVAKLLKAAMQMEKVVDKLSAWQLS